jgi:hypothetical protein
VNKSGVAPAAINLASQMAIERRRTKELQTELERRQAKTLDHLANDHNVSIPYHQA